ncbi:SusD/RagB family nutrient-binding outer membrane lipoprotein [Lutibacter maritimus]|uniref:Starch-binding associating with outer membrane n=1 Tax=Lutibacter maritimus TaxID=593133 RepID=A0A1I6RYS6_9FLAO|nr:SusD/RagB family nutrient-binding outer membrane lipoprotein [Lutibacter maritimus]SFS69859.1 Starch-binding associating with outer membrane [Lutibacter maritimus]
MKKIIFTLLSLLILFMSCDDQLDINRDPDLLSPEGVAFATELPACIAGVAGAQGAELAIIGGIWSQFYTQSPSANQYRTVDSYQIGSSTLIARGPWHNMYDALGDIRNIKRNALTQENWKYFLIASVLECYSSQILADTYDQIPYTEANDLTNFQPAFNTGEEVYDLMIADLDAALSKDLSASKGSSPADDDFVFNGDMTKWVQFGNTLKLRILLRQVNARPSVASGAGSLSNFLSEDASMHNFADLPSNSNPLYESDRRQLNVASNLRASTTMYSYLNENGDDRLNKYYGVGNPLNQGDYQSLDAPTSISIVNLSATTPVYFISTEESLFLQAEANLRYNSGANTKVLYDAAVLANFSKWGLDGSQYISSGGVYEFPSAGTFEEKLEAIITQKWIASFPGNGFESFFEHNRTGYPVESSVPQTSGAYVPGQWTYSVNGATNGAFPQRLEWPSTEVVRNANTPDVISLTTPVWWK